MRIFHEVISIYITLFTYIIYIYNYPRCLAGMLIDNADKENWLPLQPLTETQEKNKAKTYHLIEHTIQKECAKTRAHQANQAPQASKATQIQCKCKEFKKTQRQLKNMLHRP